MNSSGLMPKRAARALPSSSLKSTYPSGPVQQLPHMVQEKRRPGPAPLGSVASNQSGVGGDWGFMITNWQTGKSATSVHSDLLVCQFAHLLFPAVAERHQRLVVLARHASGVLEERPMHRVHHAVG